MCPIQRTYPPNNSFNDSFVLEPISVSYPVSPSAENNNANANEDDEALFNLLVDSCFHQDDKNTSSTDLNQVSFSSSSISSGSSSSCTTFDCDPALLEPNPIASLPSTSTTAAAFPSLAPLNSYFQPTPLAPSSTVSAPQVDSTPVSDQQQQDPEEEDPKPKRPLTGYNWFFQQERQLLLKQLPSRESQGKKTPRNSHGKMGFAAMARHISTKWKALSTQDRAPFEALAKTDKQRYRQAMTAWKERQQVKISHRAAQPMSQVTTADSASFLANNMTHLLNASTNNNKESSLVNFLKQHQQQGSTSTQSQQQQHQDGGFLNLHWSHGGNNMFLQHQNF